MKDYFHPWLDTFLELHSRTLASRTTVTGECNKPAGPRRYFARIKISVEPAAHFEVMDSVKGDEARKEGYREWAVFGLMDVFLTCEGSPLRDVRISLEEIEHHPVDSSPWAFRLAGRDAARKILDPHR